MIYKNNKKKQTGLSVRPLYMGMSGNYSAFDTKNAFPTCGVPL